MPNYRLMNVMAVSVESEILASSMAVLGSYVLLENRKQEQKKDSGNQILVIMDVAAKLFVIATRSTKNRARKSRVKQLLDSTLF